MIAPSRQRARASLISFALILSCTTAAPAPAPAAERPVAGGRVIEGATSDIRTLQPVLWVDGTSGGVVAKIYASLIRFDPRTGEIRPNLATWTRSADGLTYVWEIDAKASWSDDRPIVAEDWLALVKAVARSKKTARKSAFQDIDGFAAYRDGTATSIAGIAADGKRLTVRFTKVLCAVLANAFNFPPIPAHVFGRYTVDADPSKNLDDAPENTAPTVASGPFIFRQWQKGAEVVLGRNAGYWKGAPLVDEYVLKIVADTNALVIGIKTGELNVAQIEPKDLDDISRVDRLKVYRYPALQLHFIGWNTRSTTAPALRDKRIRQALAYGLDMDLIVRNVLFGEGVRMTAFHPPVSWAAAQSLNAYAFDRARAEQLIRDAGYVRGSDGYYAKDGTTLGFTLTTNPENRLRASLQEIAIEQYKQIGVQVAPRADALAALGEKITTGSQQLEAYIVGLSLGFDPDTAFDVWHSSVMPDPAVKKTGFNATGFSAPELDRALEQGRSGDCTVPARKRAYEQFNRILNEEQPYNFGFSPNTLIAASVELRGLEPATFGTSHNIETWWLKR